MAVASPPRAVVFDLDGLMFNTEELYQDVGSELLRRRGHEFTVELLDAMMGRPNRVALQIMIDWHSLTDTVEILTTETDQIFPDILAARLAPMPGVPELLVALERAGIPKAIATSSRRSFVTSVLAHFGWEPRFNFILTCEDVIQGKPHPEIYLRAAERFGMRPEEVAVLEDSQTGSRAGAAAGSRVISVPAGHSRRHDFSVATLIADTLADPRVYQLLGIDS